ncbi:MAG TPA: transposase [Planctomycetaceae bacterium]|nr:transposase [Planctomycetaceae bacterium]
MRDWLLTWTTYGTWLPGDARGSVTRVRVDDSPRKLHNKPGTPYDGPVPGLNSAARAALKGPPVFLDRPQAERIRTQLVETAAYRGWRLLTAAVMRNHVHLVVVADDQIESAELLRTFKSYASRVLNCDYPKPESGRWWTTSASRRGLPNEAAIHAAVRYVRDQPGALAVYLGL